MANINVVILEGNLVKAAELKRWDNGTPYCNFTLASNKSYKDKDDNWVDVPNFIDCLIKGPYGESQSKNLLKGRHITIEGSIEQRSWKDKEGKYFSKTYVKVDRVHYVPGSFQPKDAAEGPSNNGAPKFKPVNQNNYDQQPPEDYGPLPDENYEDSEIPF